MTPQSKTFTLDGVSCAGCVAKIERHIEAQTGVVLARGNISAKRIRLVWDPQAQSPETLIEQIRSLGYDALPFVAAQSAPKVKSLLPQLGLAGFATMNIMAISISVWAGTATDMGLGSMQFLHWISAALATPVVIYSAAVFYRPSLRALRHGHVTMDTPISIAVIVTYLASLWETFRGTEHVYFDAVSALVFFLLIGRVLEQILKKRSGDAAENLRSLMRVEARREREDGSFETLPAEDLSVEDIVIVGSGERVPGDGLLLSDVAQIDESAITGESVPRDVVKSDLVTAGSIVHVGPARLKVTHVGEDAAIGKIERMISDTAAAKGKQQERADSFARAYIPLVLVGGALGFVIWYYLMGASFADALMISVAVLVVTCPCAAGLATPAVSYRAVDLLMRAGIIVKSGQALERLANTSSIIADKTGTLSAPLPDLDDCDATQRRAAATLAAGSSHPLARTLWMGTDAAPREGLLEIAGKGIEAPDGTRLGSAAFVGLPPTKSQTPTIWFREPGETPQKFTFSETPREGLNHMLGDLKDMNLPVTILSGDSTDSVAAFAKQYGIRDKVSAATPAQKLAFLNERKQNGDRPLMLGDGINDAPSLQAAHVSVSLVGATEVAQVSADIVLTRPDLDLLPKAIRLSRQAQKLIAQNLQFSTIYNVVTVPLALAGYLNPLIAALLMSSSSVIVLLNGFRLKALS